MTFEVDLLRPLPEERLCAQAHDLAAGILADYPFDESYRKEIAVSFHPPTAASGDASYPLGVLGLNRRDRDAGGPFPCYLKYKAG